jgi:glycosyltransferase involved in cell wall biosynthesis
MPAAPTSPLVSVLMPAYNHAPYVRTAVESVLGQTYDNLELIAIDDASSDATWEVLQSFEDPRLRISRHDANQGAHVTLNEALALAKGDFIAIINSDDIFHPERLAACLNELELTGADLVGTDILLVNDDGQLVTSHWWVESFENLKRVWMETQDWPAALMEGNVFMTTSNFCFRRSWFEAVGGFNDLRFVLDYEWLLRGLVRGRKLAWLDLPLLSYRLHAHNTISERPLGANLECAAMLRQVFPSLLAANVLEKTRLEHLASQWERIEKYIGEIGAALRHEALVAREDELFQLIRDRDQWIAERNDWIYERDTRIAELDSWVAARDVWIAERDVWIAERDAHIAACEAALADSREERKAIEGSLSFRLGHALTAPARWLRDQFERK